MPEGCCGTIKDLDGVHYEISKEDEMLYQEYVQKMNFNKMKVYPMCFLRLIRKKNSRTAQQMSVMHACARACRFGWEQGLMYSGLWVWNWKWKSRWLEKVVTEKQYGIGKRIAITWEVYGLVSLLISSFIFFNCCLIFETKDFQKLWIVWSCWQSKYQGERFVHLYEREWEIPAAW